MIVKGTSLLIPLPRKILNAFVSQACHFSYVLLSEGLMHCYDNHKLICSYAYKFVDPGMPGWHDLLAGHFIVTI